MLEKLADYLNRLVLDQKNDSQFEDLWDEKRKFITYIYLTYCQQFGANLTIYESEYKTRLENLESFPLSDKPDDKWVEVWLKLYWAYLNDGDEQLKVFESFLSPEYNPPKNLFELMIHLQYLQIYYAYFIQLMPLSINARVDFVALKLTQTAWAAIELFDRKGTDRDRVLSSIEAKIFKKTEVKQQIVEEFYRISKRQNLSKHRIATIIKNNLEQKGQKSPHTDTIKSYLKEDGKI